MGFYITMNYKQNCLRKLFTCSFLTLISTPAHGQIIPDKTLPKNSEIKLEGNRSIIKGGTRAGNNLFHSFEEFSIPTGGEAYFSNGADVSNIISRVTGKSISNIDGLIKANGNANLFLINPNGIIFGKNASLDIGGSFVGSTANSFKFADGKEFSAAETQTTGLLSINVPSGLQYGSNSGKISNQSQVTDSESEVVGLRVKPGKTLGLIGGDVSFDNGTVDAPDGRVELGGLKDEGTVGLSGDGSNLSFNFPQEIERSDVSLSNGSQVNVAGNRGGEIAINSRNVQIIEKSSLEAGIKEELNSIDTKAGNIDINATEAIDLEGGGIISDSIGLGATAQGGDINIKTGNLLVKDAKVSTLIFGGGKGGNLNIDAKDIQLIGTSGDGDSPSGLFAQTDSDLKGDGGNLKIKTNTLLVQDGAKVSTRTFGAGQAGDLTVDAKDIQIIGTSKNGNFRSGLFTEPVFDPKGDGGRFENKNQYISS